MNRGLQLLGVFLFINGIYVAFFSDNIFTTLGYYFVVAAATCLFLSRILSPESPLVPAELRTVLRRFGTGSERDRANRSRPARTGTKRTAGFDGRRIRRRVVRALDRIDLPALGSNRRNGRDRL